MFGGKKPHGFTIVETMIFLGVSGLIFLSVVTLISGQQNKTQFSQGTREIFSQVQAISNDVQTGYYDTATDVKCVINGDNPPSVTYTSNAEGSNAGCTFIGRVIQFNPTDQTGNGNSQQINVYTIVGRQYPPSTNTTDPLTTNLSDAETVPLTGSDIKTITMPPGVTVKSVYYTNAGNRYYTSIIGFFSKFPASTGGGINSGSASSILVPIPSNTGIGSASEFINHNTGLTDATGIQNTTDADGSAVTPFSAGPQPTILNPDGGVTICLASDYGDKYYGVIQVGGNAAVGSTGSNPLSVQFSTTPTSGGNICP